MLTFKSHPTAPLFRCFLFLSALVLALGSPGLSGPVSMARADDDARIRYRVSFEGVEDRALEDLLRATSQLVTLRDRPPATLAGLRQRMNTDLERFRTALKSEARYEGNVYGSIDSSDRPVRVRLDVEPGRLFTLESYRIDLVESPPPSGAQLVPRSGGSLGLGPGAPATGPAIVAAEARALNIARANGFSFAQIRKREVLVNRRDGVVNVVLRMELGQRTRFGPLLISGLERVEKQVVAEHRTWKVGEIYDPALVAEFAQRLEMTGLFRSVRARAGEKADEHGNLPVIIDLQERPRRSIGGGVSYATNEGPGGSVFWQHRNLAGEGEDLRLDLEVATLRQSLAGVYTQPRFRRFNQSLSLSLRLVSEESDAFQAQSLSARAGVRRRLSPRLMIGTAIEGEYARTEDNDVATDSYLGALPLSLRWDSTDNLLDPSRGRRLDVVLTPTGGFNEGALAYFQTDIKASTYLALGSRNRWVLAGRTRFGSIAGTTTERVPAGRRLYSGGGGSVRPIAFQFAGPLDDEEAPIGGRSTVEVGGEVRVRATESIGIVPFIEGGTAFDSSVPDFSEQFLWGGGLGAFYKTPVGPFRLDVAVPFNGRDDVDDPFQVYISLGQSF